MWAVTGWAVATWLKITVFLALGVGAAWRAAYHHASNGACVPHSRAPMGVS